MSVFFRNPKRTSGFFKASGQVLVYLYVLLLSIVLYTFLHEGGHALIGVLSGGKITGFSLNFWNLSAHVDLNVTFNQFQSILNNAAGACLPLFVWAIFISLAPKLTDPVLQIMKFTSGIIPISSLLAWIIIPLLIMIGQSPADDSANFVHNTGIYPPLVSGCALLLMIGGFCLMSNRLGGYREWLKRLQAQINECWSPTSRRSLLALTLLAAVAIGISIVLNGGILEKSRAALPKDYLSVGVVDLGKGRLDLAVVYQFDVSQNELVSLFFILPYLSSGPAEITLVGPEGYHNVFFKAGDDFKGGGTVNPTDLALGPGNFQICMTFPKANGQVEIGLKRARE